MPLPVEKSQGSVQSLVARFQNAANRDAETTRRQSLPPPNRRTSSTGGAAPVTAPLLSTEGVADLQMGAESTEGSGSGGEPKQHSLQEPSQTSLKPVEEQVNDEADSQETALRGKVEKVVEGVKALAIGGSSNAEKANEDRTQDAPKPGGSSTSQPEARATPKPTPSSQKKEAKSPAPNGKVAAAATPSTSKSLSLAKPDSTRTPKTMFPHHPKANAVKTSGLPSPTTSSKMKSPTTAKAFSPVNTTTPSIITPRVRTTSGPAKATSSSPATSSQAKSSDVRPAASAHRMDTSAPSALQGGNPTHKPLDKPKTSPQNSASASYPTSIKQPPQATRTPKLVPSATGPTRRTPYANTSTHTEPPPLRSQLTGTPSKPTASSLAKTRTPSNTTSTTPADRRQSSSLGRKTGESVRARLGSASPSPAQGTTAASKVTSTPTTSRAAPSSSVSRLMQGTAASRAKAAEKTNSASPQTQKNTPSKSSKPMAPASATKSNATGKPAMTGSKSNSGDKEDGDAIGPPPIRLGFAGAGMGKGGKTGKEYNEERNAKIRAGQVSLPGPGDEEKAGHTVAGEENHSTAAAAAGSAPITEAEQNDSVGPDNLAGRDDTAADTEVHNGDDTTEELKRSSAAVGVSQERGSDLAGDTATEEGKVGTATVEDQNSDNAENAEEGNKGHLRGASHGSLEEIPDIG